MTVRVLAVLAEQLLKSDWARQPGLSEIAISDEVLLDPPELVAWRDEDKKQTIIRVRR